MVLTEYYTAFKKNPEFTTSIPPATEINRLHEYAKTHLQLHYGNVSYEAFSREYSSSGWVNRKIMALPMALWSIFVKAVYHFVKALLNCSRQNFYKAYRDLQAGWGHLVCLLNDRFGSYHIQKSAFHIQCYDCFENNLSPKRYKSLRELERVNLQTCDSDFRGNIIFVDITACGGNQAIQKIKKINEKQKETMSGSNLTIPKKCHFGVSCFFNFAIAAANKIDKIILLDYDPIVVRFNRIARDTLINSENSMQFKQQFKAACQKDAEINKRQFYPKKSLASSNMDNLNQILNSLSSFLSDEKDFKFVKRIAEAGEIHIYQGSIYDEKMIETIVALAKTEGTEFSSLFLSNIYDWDQDAKKRELFIKNIQKMSSDKTLIVDVVPSPKDGCNVHVDSYINPRSKKLYNFEKVRK
jgi:hypothetical protein